MRLVNVLFAFPEPTLSSHWINAELIDGFCHTKDLKKEFLLSLSLYLL